MNLKKAYKDKILDFDAIKSEKIRIFEGNLDYINLPGAVTKIILFDGAKFRSRFTQDEIYIKARSEELTSRLIEKCENVEFIDFNEISLENIDSPLKSRVLQVYSGVFAYTRKNYKKRTEYKIVHVSFNGKDIKAYLHKIPSGMVYISEEIVGSKGFSLEKFMKENGILRKTKKTLKFPKIHVSSKSSSKKTAPKIKMWGPKSNARGYKIPGARGGAKLWS